MFRNVSSPVSHISNVQESIPFHQENFPEAATDVVLSELQVIEPNDGVRRWLYNINIDANIIENALPGHCFEVVLPAENAHNILLDEVLVSR